MLHKAHIILTQLNYLMLYVCVRACVCSRCRTVLCAQIARLIKNGLKKKKKFKYHHAKN